MYQPRHGACVEILSTLLISTTVCSEITDNLLCSAYFRISTEHSPKLQIRSHSYLRAVSEVSINRSLDTLDPKTLLDPKMLLSSPQYRSRNESYMRAMSTISQVSGVPPFPFTGFIGDVTSLLSKQ